MCVCHRTTNFPRVNSCISFLQEDPGGGRCVEYINRMGVVVFEKAFVDRTFGILEGSVDPPSLTSTASIIGHRDSAVGPQQDCH
jgi:hypothetical protein